jgi:TRAP-type transport system periplasmic protein
MVSRMSTWLVAGCLTLGSVALSQGALAADFTLRFATINAEDSVAYQELYKPFAEAVAKDSGGRVEVAIKPLGGYGKPADLFNMVERGDIEMAFTVQGYNPGRFPQTSVMELPLISDSSVDGTRVIEAMLKEGRFDRDYASVKPLGLTVLAPYGIFTTGRKLDQIKDLRGLRVRTPSPTVGLALARLGMIPLGVPVNLISDTLANNTVDAITFGWDSVAHTAGAGGKVLVDQLKVLIDANFAAPAMMIVMNKAASAALPADLQTIIEQRAVAMLAQSAEWRDKSDATARDALKSDPRFTYIALTPAQQADIERLIQPAVADWKLGMTRAGLDGPALYDRAQELMRSGNSVAVR